MKYRKLAIVLVSIVAAYAVLGFFVLPLIIKPKLVSAIREATNRSVRVGDLALNPFTLSATVSGFELKDRDDSTLASFAKLHVDYEIISLLQNSYIFSEVSLDSPFVALRVMADGKMSFSDLISTGEADTSVPAQPPKSLVVGKFSLTDGSLVYQDLSRSTPMRKEIDSLNLSLMHFTTKAGEEGGYEFSAMTGRGENLHWRGKVSVTPPRSSGVLEITDLRAASLAEFMGDRLTFSVGSGMVDVRGQYEFDGSRDEPVFSLRNGSLTLSELLIVDPKDSLPPVSLPHVEVGGISFGYPQQELTLDTLRLEGGEIRASLLADGSMTLADLFTPTPDPSDTAQSESKFNLTIRRLATSAMKFTLVDKTGEPEAPMVLSDLAIDLSDFCYGKPGTAQLVATGMLNGAGTIRAAGKLALDPQQVDLDIQVVGTPLAALQPYASRFSRARSEAGTVSLQGHIAQGVRNTETIFQFHGGVTLHRFRISDPVMNEDLTRWDRLELKGIEFSTVPPRLSIAAILATRPYIRAIIAADRTLNFQHIFGQEADTTADTTSHRAGAAQGADSTDQSATTIGSITIVDGAMNFTDLSLTPNFTVNIQEMEGTIKGLSSEEVARADVELVGKVDRYAPVSIRGQINPLSDEAFTDILMKFEGIELTTFSPYASKFAGYKIDRGKLNMDLHYKLNKRYLEGSNKLVLDQLTLGEEIKGPDVTNLPVKLAVALLKDSHGVIDLDIPVSGSLDDPEFSVFPIILKALLNVLWKLVTAPFALLGALFGGSGEELEFVAFSPGSDTLAAPQQAKLATVAKGLIERPALQLDLRGSASNTADRDAIAEAVVMGKIRPSGEGPLTPAEEKSLLTLYQQTYKEDAFTLVPDGVTSEEERGKAACEAAKRKLVASVMVAENDLRDLAQRRAAAILGHLTRQGGVDASRVFLQEPETTANPTEGMVRTKLTLTAR